MEEKYFAAANSSRGFVSYFDCAFGKAERRYIIKGGPGTGKSYFMRQVAHRAEECGHTVVYFYCSSDQDSLDGILIDGKIALFDGTAPHSAEASCPGARDELIDLGQFWSSERLEAKRHEIEALQKKKSAAYSRAYDCLAAAGEVEKAVAGLVSPCILQKKLCEAAARYLRHLPNGEAFSSSELAVNSIGMKGELRFLTLEKRAKTTVSVSDHLSSAYMFFDELILEAERKQLEVRISRDPIFPEYADAVEFPDFGLLFYLGEGGSKNVNMQRFIDFSKAKEIRKSYKELRACKAGLISAARAALAEVADHHFALESIYIATMDFDAKDKFTHNFTDRLMLALSKKV